MGSARSEDSLEKQRGVGGRCIKDRMAWAVLVVCPGNLGTQKMERGAARGASANITGGGCWECSPGA